MNSPKHPGTARRPGRLRLAFALATLAAAGGSYLVYQGPVDAGAPATAAQAPAAVPVSVATVIERTITEWDEFSGRLEAIDGVEVRSRVAGYIESVNFEPGSRVEKGDTLFVIDPRPFAAELARAEAEHASARARLELAQSELARAKRLMAGRAIAEREFDERQNAQREAQAALQGARAALEIARLNLGYTRITAPISGRVGRAEVTVGNLIGAGATGPRLTSVVSNAPIYASFEVDEQSFLEYLSNARQGQGERDVSAIPVWLGLAHEDGHPRRGRLEFVDNRLDPRSGTIMLRAVFDNEDGVLTPGMFARLKVGGAGEKRALLVHDRAIGTDQNKRFVLVVGDEATLAWREVELGPIVDGLRVIRSGLQAGETIVVNGLHRVRPGVKVVPGMVSMETLQAPAAAVALATSAASAGSEPSAMNNTSAGSKPSATSATSATEGP